MHRRLHSRLRVSTRIDVAECDAVSSGTIQRRKCRCMHQLQRGVVLSARVDVADTGDVPTRTVQHRRQWVVQPVCWWLLLPGGGIYHADAEPVPVQRGLRVPCRITEQHRGCV